MLNAFSNNFQLIFNGMLIPFQLILKVILIKSSCDCKRSFFIKFQLILAVICKHVSIDYFNSISINFKVIFG